MPKSEEMPKSRTEWTHDYGLRRLEERGVEYEDEAGGSLDHATTLIKDHGQAGEQQGKPLPSPGELADEPGGPETPEPACAHENGRGREQ